VHLLPGFGKEEFATYQNQTHRTADAVEDYPKPMP
jgi:hypothetical protein